MTIVVVLASTVGLVEQVGHFLVDGELERDDVGLVVDPQLHGRDILGQRSDGDPKLVLRLVNVN